MHTTIRRPVFAATIAALACSIMAAAGAAAADTRPNILWFVVDDMSPDLPAYRSVPITTPHLDRLAREGTLFTHAYTTAPVCSPSRSAMITGMYQTAIRAQNHRSGRGTLKIHLPKDVRPAPALFHETGYYTCIGDGLADDDKPQGKGRRQGLGKTDYNFEWDPAMYDGEDWSGRNHGQPFFMQVMLPGGKIRAERPESFAAARALATRTLGSSVRPDDVELPPYLPRDPVLLDDRAAYLDSVRLTDHHVGQVLARLEQEGVLDDTLVIFMTDHGISHARAKQFLYDEGTHIPFIVRGPGVPRGVVRDDFVEQIDMAPTSLAAAGIPIPRSMQGRNLFATDAKPRDAVFAARDRCDETVDKLRSVRTDRFLYIRNGYPGRPHLQPNAYKDGKAVVETLRRLHAAGELPPLTEKLLFSPTRPPEELYLWRDDPWQLKNLAADPAHHQDLEACRVRLDRWIKETGNPPEETEAQYDADMAVYVGKGNSIVEKNIAEMKRQAAAERKEAEERKADTPPVGPAAALPPAAAIPVTMLVPGFTVRELPVTLTNLNNIEYLPDGSLVAGGYDGRFHLLRDSDGDGLEDRVDTFSPETSANYPLGVAVKDGAVHFVLSDEVIRFVDADGDGIPETRETVAKGFDDPALVGNEHLMQRRVDSTMALAFGPDGSLYLTLGHSAPGKPWWPGYATTGRRGSLLRMRPDGTIEHLASGLRYVMSLQFNQDGDLFGTDQEGATWCANGNPFDELLHLDLAGARHYGFPPRHPEKLPDVVDEPSVFDYGPQHQSACGFRFNGPAPHRGRFGPEFWADDAIVTGESRGKLWRTSLAKTAAGYVACNHQFAAIGMLPVDVAISPRGDLVVCCHSGPPDWGAGPPAAGRIFKISHTAPELPQPVAIWPESETRTLIAFDRPIETSRWREAARLTRIESGRAVGPADRLETLRPGYAVVTLQGKQPRTSLTVNALGPGPDATTLVIETPPRRQAMTYGVALPGGIDLAHDLSGVSASWQAADGAVWEGWLPHPDLTAAKHLLRGSRLHEPFWQKLAQQGSLGLRGRFDPFQMLIPTTQEGSTLDWKPEPELITLVVTSDAPVRGRASGTAVRGVEQHGDHEVRMTIESARADEWIDLRIDVATPASRIDVSFHTSRDPRPRAIPLRRFLLPFAEPAPPLVTERVIPEIAGGDYEAGKVLFAGKAACATCHQFGGVGAKVGPPLDNQRHRDYASVWRDIVDPNATLNPDAVAYAVTLIDGTAATGVRLAETPNELTLAEPGGATRVVRKTAIDELTPLAVSLMPVGIDKLLAPAEIRDLMNYLLSEPPKK